MSNAPRRMASTDACAQTYTHSLGATVSPAAVVGNDGVITDLSASYKKRFRRSYASNLKAAKRRSIWWYKLSRLIDGAQRSLNVAIQ